MSLTDHTQPTTAPVRRLGVAVVGAGYWGPNLIRNFYAHDLVDLVAVCDRDPARLMKVGKQYPSVQLVREMDALLANPAVEAVVIATPVQTHFPLARHALQAGKHVLVEKPMAMNSAECRTLIALAAERNLTLMVDHTFVYHGAVRRMKHEIESGALGDLLYFDSVRINLGLFQSDINVVWDLAPHDLSMMDYLIGKQPRAVQATGACHAGNGLEDVAYITVHFDDNVIAHFNVSWLSPVKIRQILVGGTKQMILYDDLQPMEKLRIYDKGITVQQPQSDEERYASLVDYRMGDMLVPHLDTTEALKTEVAHFVDCALNGKRPLTDGEAGLRVVQILEATDRSIRSGQIQHLDGAVAEITPAEVTV
ncbi:MAG: Gfo/Idh/MocA family protein [Candidatus Melainabacteria bacterium]